jgi:hypothetical protein
MGCPAPSPIFKARRESATEHALAMIEGREFLNVLLYPTLERSEAKDFGLLTDHEKFFSHRLLKQARWEFDARAASC